jgi:hypothetical protein
MWVFFESDVNVWFVLLVRLAFTPSRLPVVRLVMTNAKTMIPTGSMACSSRSLVMFPKISKYARCVAVTATQHVDDISFSVFTFESHVDFLNLLTVLMKKEKGEIVLLFV